MRRIRRWAAVAAAAAAVLLTASAPSPKELPVTTPPAPPAAPAPTTPMPSSAATLDAADLGAWLDGFFPTTLKQGKIAGAQVVVVKDGKVLAQRGYGYADVAAKTPMDPARNQMRIGSTSKLFTWTAVMQLVEAGKIDLDADVNRYLDFKLSPPGGRPVTMNDLMTHRGGFEEGLKDVLATDPRWLKSMGGYLKENERPFMFPPGEVPAYSNYGTTLAGYIVQRVSGENYDTYVERHILRPLQMSHTTSRQPLPPGFAATTSKGYRTSETPPSPFELVGTAPAGAFSTTAADMAHFMIAHLQDGRYENAQILKPETARLMHTPTIKAPPGFDTLAHGFFHEQRNGRLVIGHGGDTVVFHSDFNLLPQEGVGIFVSFNSRGENDAVYGARERLFELFLDRYFPAPRSVTPPAIASAAGDAAALAGHYETSRRVETGFISLFYMLQQDQVAANPDGTIGLSSAAGKRFREVAPGLWHEVDGSRQLKVIEVQGRRAIMDSADPILFLEAAPLGRNSSLFQLVAALSLLGLLLTVLVWPVAAWIVRTRKLPPMATGRLALARRLTRIGALADLVYLGGWYAIVAPILRSEVSFYNEGLDGTIRFLQIAAIVPILAAAIGIWSAVLAFRSPLGWGHRTRAVLVALALVGFLWFARVSGLISWTLNY